MVGKSLGDNYVTGVLPIKLLIMRHVADVADFSSAIYRVVGNVTRKQEKGCKQKRHCSVKLRRTPLNSLAGYF